MEAKSQHQAKCRFSQTDQAVKPSILSKHYTSPLPRSDLHPISSPRIARTGRIRHYRSAIIRGLHDAYGVE